MYENSYCFQPLTAFQNGWEAYETKSCFLHFSLCIPKLQYSNSHFLSMRSCICPLHSTVDIYLSIRILYTKFLTCRLLTIHHMLITFHSNESFDFYGFYISEDMPKFYLSTVHITCPFLIHTMYVQYFSKCSNYKGITFSSIA